MKVIAAYLLAVLGGNTCPTAEDLKAILGSELRKRLEESEHKLGLSMPFDEAKQSATQLDSEITSLERYGRLSPKMEFAWPPNRYQLSDLEKIGLSSKQIHNLFSRAARGIFDKEENTTSSCRESLVVN